MIRSPGWILLTATVILSVARLMPAVQTNLVNTQALRGEMTAYLPPAYGNTSSQAAVSCASYPAIALYFRDSRINPAEGLRRMTDVKACLSEQRARLLTPAQAEYLWSLDRHAEVCQALQAVQAGSRLVDLIKRSFDKNDLTATEEYLGCLEGSFTNPSSISPFTVAGIYYDLGRHYEQVGNALRAIDYYDLAGKRYPVTWAAPIIARSNLLWDNGNQAIAITSILDGLGRTSDVTASFYLWLQLAALREKQKDNDNALCAYQHAGDLYDKVPRTNTNDRQLSEIMNHITALRAMPDINAGACAPVGTPQ